MLVRKGTLGILVFGVWILTGRVVRVSLFDRARVSADPDTLYVFGDNLERRGQGGQAVIRGLPNAVGVPTKRRPSMDEDAFFADADLREVQPLIDAAFARLHRHLAHGGTIAWPADGVGTGRARLTERAPTIARYIALRVRALLAASGQAP